MVSRKVSQLSTHFLEPSVYLTFQCAEVFSWILSDSKIAYKNPVCLPPLGRSDHAVIHCPSVSNIPSPSVRKIQFRVKTPTACAKLRSLIANSAILPHILLETDVNKATEMFLNFLTSSYDELFHFEVSDFEAMTNRG